MSFTENLVIKAGSALAGPLYAAWRRKSGRTEQNSRSLKELIACDERNTLAIHKIERDIITLAEGIIETLIPVFAIDGAQIADDQKEAIALAIIDTFEKGGAIP